MSSHLPSSWRPSTRASIGEDLTTQNRTNQTSIAEDYIGKKSIVSPDLSAPLLRVQRKVFISQRPRNCCRALREVPALSGLADEDP